MGATGETFDEPESQSLDEHPATGELRPVVTRPAARIVAPPPRLWHSLLHRARHTWRQRVRHRWQALRAPVLLGVAVASLVLGTIGYRHLTSVHPRYGLLDSIYRAVGLFGIGGTAAPPIPLTLQIARILAPFVTGYAAIGTVIALTRSQARAAGIRLFARHHLVVAGLGDTGRRLAETLVDRVPVVAIESDGSSDALLSARLRGVRALTGDASDPGVLRQAAIAHAHTLVVLCGSGSVNVDVAAAAARALPRGGRPFTIFVHLDNLDLWTSLAAEGATFRSRRPDVRLEYFNTMANAAQLLVEKTPPFEGHESDRPHLLFVGIEGIGEQLVLQLARLWLAVRAERPAGSSTHEAKLWLTLTGPSAEADLATLVARYPSLAEIAELDARPFAIESAAFQAGAAMAGPSDRNDVTRAYVCLLDEGNALVAALALHARADSREVPVTVTVTDSRAGVSVILGSDRGRFGAIEAFGVLSEATDSHLLLRGTNELLARAQHAQWLRGARAAGISSAKNPNVRSWEALTEAQREFNREFADDVHHKLERVGCMLVPMPLPASDGPAFAFTDAEMDALAHWEHERWMQAKLADGWRYGEPRDEARKIHDQIKPWEQLSEPEREKDRAAVRELPGVLALAGFAIRRLPAGTSTR